MNSRDEYTRSIIPKMEMTGGKRWTPNRTDEIITREGETDDDRQSKRHRFARQETAPVAAQASRTDRQGDLSRPQGQTRLEHLWEGGTGVRVATLGLR